MKKTVELRYAVANPVLNNDKPTQFMQEIKELTEEKEEAAQP